MKKTLKSWLQSAVLLAGIAMSGFGHAATETITYYHNDISGSPLLATDATGAVVWKENYRPYGEKLNKQAVAADNKVGFAGKPFDNNTGLSYMGARYYDPVLGRFTGIDPKEVDPKDLHSFNRYAYANNNPYKFVDPDGREPIDAIKSWWNSSIAGFKSEGPAEAAMRMLQGLPVEGAAMGVVGALKAARVAESGLGAAQAVKETATVQRWMSQAELQATKETGLLRGGRDGTHYVTDAANTDPVRARQRLALPQTPEVRVTMEVQKDALSAPSKVKPDFNMPGGGMERTASGKIPAQIIKVD